MSRRKVQFITGEYYHIFNRGVDKRDIFLDEKDLDRFFQSMQEFNVADPIGSIYENSFRKNRELGSGAPKLKKLVEFVCYCLSPNHYHFLLRQLSNKGIEKFMQKMGGYPKYFNEKYNRSGALFQGPFKAVNIDSEDYLVYLSIYINKNNDIHGTQNGLSRSSWNEYIASNNNGVCSKNIILEQFDSLEEYKKYSKEALNWAKENKEAKKYLLEH